MLGGHTSRPGATIPATSAALENQRCSKLIMFLGLKIRLYACPVQNIAVYALALWPGHAHAADVEQLVSETVKKPAL